MLIEIKLFSHEHWNIGWCQNELKISNLSQFCFLFLSGEIWNVLILYYDVTSLSYVKKLIHLIFHCIFSGEELVDLIQEKTDLGTKNSGKRQLLREFFFSYLKLNYILKTTKSTRISIYNMIVNKQNQPSILIDIYTINAIVS